MCVCNIDEPSEYGQKGEVWISKTRIEIPRTLDIFKNVGIPIFVKFAFDSASAKSIRCMDLLDKLSSKIDW